MTKGWKIFIATGFIMATMVPVYWVLDNTRVYSEPVEVQATVADVRTEAAIWVPPFWRTWQVVEFSFHGQSLLSDSADNVQRFKGREGTKVLIRYRHVNTVLRQWFADEELGIEFLDVVEEERKGASESGSLHAF